MRRCAGARQRGRQSARVVNRSVVVRPHVGEEITQGDEFERDAGSKEGLRGSVPSEPLTVRFVTLGVVPLLESFVLVHEIVGVLAAAGQPPPESGSDKRQNATEGEGERAALLVILTGSGRW